MGFRVGIGTLMFFGDVNEKQSFVFMYLIT